MSNNVRAAVSYLVVVTDSRDEAESLASYMNSHGVAAFRHEGHEVNLPLTRPEDVLTIETLKASWRHFYEHSETGILETLSLFEVPSQ